MESLNALLADGVVDEVLGQLKVGKEAEVWLVRHHGEILAAKIYKERHHRNFRNNADYKEGRQVRSSRTQRAMDKGSRFGQQAAEEAWKSAESDALHTLHAHGVHVPKPVLFYEGVLLMEVVVDASGHPAPRLVDATIRREDARALYESLRSDVVKMLCADLIHGDLSEFNVLLGATGPVIIDFPQVVAAAKNSRAEHFLRRDLDNLRRFFGSLDPTIAARHGDADEIWRAYVRRELTHDFVPTGRAPASHPRNHQAQRHFDSRRDRGNEQRRGSESQGPAGAPRGGQPAGQPQGRGDWKRRGGQRRGPEVVTRGQPGQPSERLDGRIELQRPPQPARPSAPRPQWPQPPPPARTQPPSGGLTGRMPPRDAPRGSGGGQNAPHGRDSRRRKRRHF